VVCCHARQDKIRMRDPGDTRWEIYTITDDLPEQARPAPAARTCCAAPATGSLSG